MIRTPIKLPDNYVLAANMKLIQRTPIKIPQLTWEEYYSSLYKLMQYASKNIYYKYETVCKARCLDIEDLFQEAQLVSVDCWIKYKDKSETDLLAMTRSSIWRRLRDIVHRKAYQQVDIDSLNEDEPYEEPDMDSDIDTNIKLDKVKSILKDEPVSLRILQEYISPNMVTLACMQKDMQDRIDKVQSGLLPVNLSPKTLRVTKQIIKRSLQIQGVRNFDNAFSLLKQTIRQVFKS